MGGREEVKGEARVDLHIHSRFSDGSLTVQDIIERAFLAQLRAISITDHDCIDAIPLAQKLGQSLNIEVIAGVELSANLDGKDIHILGYDFDPTDPELVGKLSEFKDARRERARKIVEKLNKMGIDLRFDTVEEMAGEGSIGRPHIADALLREELVGTYREAFERLIGYESPAYVDKMMFSPQEAFSLVRRAGGIPVLAHPQTTACDEHIPQFIRDGLMGIEVWHPEHTEQSRRFYLEYCRKRDLVYTGGSDCHGARKAKPLLGTLPIPYECVEMMRKTERVARSAA